MSALMLFGAVCLWIVGGILVMAGGGIAEGFGILTIGLGVIALGLGGVIEAVNGLKWTIRDAVVPVAGRVSR